MLFEFDERPLIRHTQNGDTEAFNTLVRKYHPRLYTHIRGLVKDVEIAKDLTQETWLKAFRAIDTFRGDAAFSSWLYRIAENVCIDFFRKQKVSRNNIEPLHTVDEGNITDTHPSPYQDLEQKEGRQILREAITHLTPTCKQVLLLYYAQDLSIKQIAICLKKSEGTIKTHLRNARLQLQESLTPYLKNQHIPWFE